MAVDIKQLADQDAQNTTQAIADHAAKQAQESKQGGEQTPPSFFQKWVTGPLQRVTTPMIDAAVSTADKAFGALESIPEWSLKQAERKGHDAIAGAITGATNIADAAGSLAASTAKELSSFSGNPGIKAAVDAWQPPAHDVWEHAKGAIMDFRDAVAVQDPTLSDNLTQGCAQLAIPFVGYSRALSAIQWLPKMGIAVGANALTDATALQPHDARMADLIALGKHTEGKFGEALNTLSPDGSALNAYIQYLGDRTNESEAEGRWKNVLDGFGANLIATPMLHAVGMTLKHGTSALRYAVDNGVNSLGDLMPPAEKPEVSNMATPKEGEATGAGETQVSSLEKDPAATYARAFLKSQTEAGNEGSLHATVTSLGQHMDSTTEEGAFYKDLLDMLASKNLGTRITNPGAGAHGKAGGTDASKTGSYSHLEDTVALYPGAFKSNASLLHTVTHEAVHAATVQALKENPAVEKAINGLIGDMSSSMKGSTRPYGMVNAKEFVAEAESNPKFQQLLKKAKSADGKPVWDHYKNLIGQGIFGLTGVAIASPMFEKVLTGEDNGA